MYAPTKWPVIGPVVDKLYDLWADWRLSMTGRPDLDQVMAERQAKMEELNERLNEGRCRVGET
ncbi:hypothetical+protein [Escherichia coli]|nr:hypothetical+protein [Escherichia coli]